MKALIVEVGTFDEKGLPTEWTFDCSASEDIAGVTLPAEALNENSTPQPPDFPGVLVAGWTIPELRKYKENIENL